MLNDMGILADSVRYYHDADAFTAANLYYVPHAGSYHCVESYGMQRDYLDICQMLVVDEGELSVTYRGETRTAGPGSLVLLDCREAHSYHAVTPIRMRWFHFEGSGSTAYTQLILNTHGFILPTGQNAEIDECIRRIMISVHQNQPNPHISITADFTSSALNFFLNIGLSHPDFSSIHFPPYYLKYFLSRLR